MPKNPYSSPPPPRAPKRQNDELDRNSRAKQELLDHFIDEMLTEQGCFVMIVFVSLLAVVVALIWYWFSRLI